MVNRVWLSALWAASAALHGCGSEVRQTEGGEGESSLLDAVYGEGYIAPADVPERVQCEDFCQWLEQRHGCDLDVCTKNCDADYVEEIAAYGCDIDVLERYYACMMRVDATCGGGCPGPIGEQVGQCWNDRAADTCETLPGFQDFGEPCPPE